MEMFLSTNKSVCALFKIRVEFFLRLQWRRGSFMHSDVILTEHEYLPIIIFIISWH